MDLGLSCSSLSLPFLVEQDDRLNQIGAGVSNLKNIARLIGDEADLHKGLLSDIDNDVDKAERGLAKETDKAKKVQGKSDMCSLYVCICILVIVVIVLVVLKLQ
jgi:hypothetical protein